MSQFGSTFGLVTMKGFELMLEDMMDTVLWVESLSVVELVDRDREVYEEVIVLINRYLGYVRSALCEGRDWLIEVESFGGFKEDLAWLRVEGFFLWVEGFFLRSKMYGEYHRILQQEMVAKWVRRQIGKLYQAGDGFMRYEGRLVIR